MSVLFEEFSPTNNIPRTGCPYRGNEFVPRGQCFEFERTSNKVMRTDSQSYVTESTARCNNAFYAFLESPLLYKSYRSKLREKL